MCNNHLLTKFAIRTTENAPNKEESKGTSNLGRERSRVKAIRSIDQTFDIYFFKNRFFRCSRWWLDRFLGYIQINLHIFRDQATSLYIYLCTIQVYLDIPLGICRSRNMHQSQTITTQFTIACFPNAIIVFAVWSYLIVLDCCLIKDIINLYSVTQ
jgi:hypothetical protein